MINQTRWWSPRGTAGTPQAAVCAAMSAQEPSSWGSGTWWATPTACHSLHPCRHRMGNMSSSEKIHIVCRILSKGWIFESIPLLLKKKTKPYYLEMITFFTSLERLYKWTSKYSLYFVIFIHLWCIHIESKVADVLVYLQRPVINEQCFYRTGISHWVLI